MLSCCRSLPILSARTCASSVKATAVRIPMFCACRLLSTVLLISKLMSRLLQIGLFPDFEMRSVMKYAISGHIGAGAYSFSAPSPVPSRALLSAPSARAPPVKAPMFGARRLLSNAPLISKLALPSCFDKGQQGEAACVKAGLCSHCFQKQMQDHGLDAQVYMVSPQSPGMSASHQGEAACVNQELCSHCFQHQMQDMILMLQCIWSVPSTAADSNYRVLVWHQ